MADRVSVLLFDLGGVLVDFSGLDDIQPLLPARMAPDALARKWGTCPHSLAYGAGAITTDQFIERFTRDWGITLAPEAFLDAWQDWVRGWLPSARELLDDLRPRYRLAALSNSNAAHWARLDALGVLDAFDMALGSQDAGRRKPDPAIFDDMVARLGVEPASVLFFDDSAANVAAARTRGLHATLVDGPDAVRTDLVDRGLL
ncbi:MAG: HAD family phosphatase [Acidobacteria bacterium]|nr:HAD family phosphatase [Acidobacteriota bacterium]